MPIGESDQNVTNWKGDFFRVDQFKTIKMVYEQYLLIYFLTEINEVNISEIAYLEIEAEYGSNFALLDSFSI